MNGEPGASEERDSASDASDASASEEAGSVPQARRTADSEQVPSTAAASDESEAKGAIEAEADTETESATETEADGKAGTEAEDGAGAKSEAQAQAKSGAKSDVEDDGEAAAGAASKASAESSAASSASAPSTSAEPGREQEQDRKLDQKQDQEPSQNKSDRKQGQGNQSQGNQGQDSQGQGNQGQDSQGQGNQGQDSQAQDNSEDKPGPSSAASSSHTTSPAPSTSPALTDPERTSKFVALKDVEERRPAARPTARPAGPNAPAAGALPPTASPQAPGSGTTPAAHGTTTPGPDPDGLGRTRQQPLPPLPPLDLLAELTNTPPPPQTPLRTVLRRVKIWSPLVLLLVIVFAVAQAVRPLPEPTLSLTADERFVFDGEKPSMPWPSEGQAAMEVEGVGSFGMSGEQKPAPIASVAKVMTAYIILRDHPIKQGDGPMITMDKQAEEDAAKSAEGESTVEVREGQKISEKEAIQAVMLASANNVARRLARWDADTEKAFVEKMNATAKQLGMTNTHYTDPSGLTASTVSTAADQVKLGKKAMENPLFREVVSQSSYVDVNGTEQKNWNRLVPVDGVMGIKTGTTTKAGGNLLFAATKEVGGTRQTIIGAVLSQPAAARDDSILTGALDAGNALMQAARGVLEAKTVVRKGDVVGTVDDGLGGTTPVVATKDVTAVGWPGLTVELKLADNGKSLPHQAEAGTEVGVLRVGDGTASAVEVPVALKENLSEPGFADKLTRVG
ncbi:D-alanyl-D-alanine carboxypeptidase [Streptomyces sp. NA04227]|uniref:D-alanyl-D-alanine carboxypeptidase n=1 Tax=Streptomyces sp. NA04227 TaxID=2742136 RepID=UPI001592716C|nr:D-alanyl-D-alanine carboxypeptidase [Streptomyces sp. NA04227]QKW07158.1 D-alanyl-D-alanine carboxypeptidase [Streptomyces sp. NA04227]